MELTNVTDGPTVPKAWLLSVPAELLRRIFSYLPWEALQSLARTSKFFRAHPEYDFFAIYRKRFDLKNGTAARRLEILNTLYNTAATDTRFSGRDLRPCSYCGILKPPKCFTGDNLHPSRRYNCYCLTCGLDPMNSLLGRGSRMDRPGNPGLWCLQCNYTVFGYQADVKGRFCRVCHMTANVEPWMINYTKCMKELRELGTAEAASVAEAPTSKSPFLHEFCQSHKQCRKILDKAIRRRMKIFTERRMAGTSAQISSMHDKAIGEAGAEEGMGSLVFASEAMPPSYRGMKLLAASRKANLTRKLARLAAKREAERTEQASQRARARRLGFNVPFEEGDEEVAPQVYAPEPFDLEAIAAANLAILYAAQDANDEDYNTENGSDKGYSDKSFSDENMSAEEGSTEEDIEDEGAGGEDANAGEEEEDAAEEAPLQKLRKPRAFLPRYYPKPTVRGYPHLTSGSELWVNIRARIAEALVTVTNSIGV